jgi:flavodoxin/NAD-dependent dihydropyrimidine dehydrogenase PreA subunit
MKSVVIYFSLTDNTEKVALAIQRGLKAVTGQCDILKIKDANPRRLKGYDLIGLGSPVIGAPVIGSEPPNFRAFINNLRFVGGKLAFAFCTHGTHSEVFFPRVVRLMKRRGLIVTGTRDWYGSVCIPHMPKPYPTDGHPDSIDLKEAEDFGQEIAERSQKILAGETGLIPPVPKLHAAILPPREAGQPSVHDHTFGEMVRYYPEKCLYPKCQLCMENCPMDGIDLSVNPPVIAKPCMNCEFCAKICPTGAMDGTVYDEFAGPIVDREIKGFLLTDIVKAEAEGRFRPLVPAAKVGTGLPLYKSHTRHPQWIIGKGLNQ